MEIADLFVVNKADKPDAQQVVRDLRNMIALAPESGVAAPDRHHGRGQGPHDEGVGER